MCWADARVPEAPRRDRDVTVWRGTLSAPEESPCAFPRRLAEKGGMGRGGAPPLQSGAATAPVLGWAGPGLLPSSPQDPRHPPPPATTPGHYPGLAPWPTTPPSRRLASQSRPALRGLRRFDPLAKSLRLRVACGRLACNLVMRTPGARPRLRRNPRPPAGNRRGTSHPDTPSDFFGRCPPASAAFHT